MDLSDNNLGDCGARAVADMLQKNSTLAKISLSGNNFTDEAAEQLAQALTVNTKLEHLDLSHNALAQHAGMADLEEIHRQLENTAMVHQKLDLSCDHFSTPKNKILTGCRGVSLTVLPTFVIKAYTACWVCHLHF